MVDLRRKAREIFELLRKERLGYKIAGVLVLEQC